MFIAWAQQTRASSDAPVQALLMMPYEGVSVNLDLGRMKEQLDGDLPEAVYASQYVEAYPEFLLFKRD
ncbi:MAG: hypothetical protein HUJ11_06185 [Arenibacter algicola]|nr:hypothetical protein [Arenibacter algicola]